MMSNVFIHKKQEINIIFFGHKQGRFQKFERPVQGNNLVPFQTIFFKIFRLIPGLANKFWGRVPKLQIIFGNILSRVET